MKPTFLLVAFLCIVGAWNFVDARSSRSSSSVRYSRYSYRSASIRTTSTLSRYTYRYSSSYTAYRATSVRYSPTRYSPSYSYYTGLYYSYYYYTYYSYYYGSTCTRTTSGSYSVDSCSAPTTTTTTTTAAPATVTCSNSGSTLTSNVGNLNSHTGYGTVEYANSMSCRWTIAASPGKIVQLSFVTFATEKNYDYVRVFDGTGTTSPLVGTFHGTSSSDYNYPGSTVVYSSGRYLHITFTSDGSVTKAGFSALYQQLSEGSVPPALPTTASIASSTTPDSLGTTYCSGVDHRNANSSFLIASHSARSGTLLPSATSGLGPYINRMNCTWIIDGMAGRFLTFYVNYMNLEACYDKLRIYRDSVSSANQLRMYCDASTPVGVQAVIAVPVAGIGGAVTFDSDGSVTRQGFIVTYDYLSTFTSPTFTGNSSTSASDADPSLTTSRTSNVCRNYAVNMRGTAMGSFTCPNPFEPADFTQCCGPDNEQYCCKLQDNTPMLIGCIVGSVILVMVIVVVCICCCRSCRETQVKKSDSASKWRRSLNKTRALTAWKRIGGAGGGSTAALIADNAEVSASGGAGPSSRVRAVTGRYASAEAYSSTALDGPGFTPPPVPPPSVLYAGGGHANAYGMGGFAPTYPTAPPPAYDTAYPPAPFRM